MAMAGPAAAVMGTWRKDRNHGGRGSASSAGGTAGLARPPAAAVVKVEVAQSCLTLCEPTDYTVHGILQVRILEWGAFPFSGDLPNPGIEPRSPALQADSVPAEPPGSFPGRANSNPKFS